MKKESEIPYGRSRNAFELFEHFAEAALGWDVGFRQLDCSTSPFLLEQLSSSQLLYCRAYFGSSFHQLGGPSVGFRTFALQCQGSTDFRWCGEAINGHDLIAYPVGGEFESSSRPGFDIFTVSLSTSLLERIADTVFHKPLSAFLGSERQVCHRPGTAILELRNSLHRLSRSLIDEHINVEKIEELLAHQVLACLDQGELATARVAIGQRAATLRRALEILSDRPSQQISVAELARLTGASRRTLEHAFRDGFNLPPAAYIKAMRLRSLNKELLRADRRNSQVGSLCRQQGFNHPGQLAADYQAMFGERPLATLQRSPTL